MYVPVETHFLHRTKRLCACACVHLRECASIFCTCTHMCVRMCACLCARMKFCVCVRVQFCVRACGVSESSVRHTFKKTKGKLSRNPLLKYIISADLHRRSQGRTLRSNVQGLSASRSQHLQGQRTSSLSILSFGINPSR